MDKVKMVKIFEEVLDNFERSEYTVISEFSTNSSDDQDWVEKQVNDFRELFYEAVYKKDSLNFKKKFEGYKVGEEKLYYLHRCLNCQNIVELFGRENCPKILICECGTSYKTDAIDGSIKIEINKMKK